MTINSGRLQNPQVADMREAEQALADGTLKVVQFDDAPADPEVLRQVNSLCAKSVSLSGFPNRSALDFLNGSASLRQLKLLLGSRNSVAELCNENLERLHICWVRGLCDLGRIGRFSKLAEFSLEDQIKLDRIDLAGAPLERLRLVNCKTLSEIDGLETLENLRELLVSRTSLNLEMLANRDWAPSVEALSLYSTSEKRNEAIKAALALQGFDKSGKPWLWC